MSAVLGSPCSDELNSSCSADLKITWQRIEQDEHLVSFLSESEFQEYQQFKIPKRRSDWLAGRVACKKAVRSLLSQKDQLTAEKQQPCQLSEIILAPSKGLRPAVSIERVHVSLSHSGEWACAVACWDAPLLTGIGVDIEKIDEPDLDILPIAFSPVEQENIKLDERRFYQFWTAKEAVLKALGVGLSIDLTELEVRVQPLSISEYAQVYFRGNQYPVKSAQWRDYFVSTCVSTIHHSST